MRQNSIIRQPIFSLINDHLIEYPTPSNISYIWGFRSTARICLVIQILTRIFLAMHYAASVDLAFLSVEHIMRDVNRRWFLRYAHANRASIFFITVYIHILRRLYYRSYTSPRELVWIIRVVIYLLIIITAFIRYVLPWRQISFWRATVITSLASALPIVRRSIVTWLWRRFSVDNATLNRFFSLHYLLPFIIARATIIHLAALHQYGSNNPLRIERKTDKISFYPYFYLKDLVGWVWFIIFFSCFVFFDPNYLRHPDNYIEANPISTPAHIVPEWYFLHVYAILRSIPNKLARVRAIRLVFVCLILLPWLHNSHVRGSQFRPLYRKVFWFFVADCLILRWIRQLPVEEPYLTIRQVASVLFFCLFSNYSSSN